jgi:hypothetical protein
MTTNYTPKKAPCPLCKGAKKVKMRKQVFVIGKEAKSEDEMNDLAEHFLNNDDCPHCNGAGEVSVQPYGDGSEAKMTREKMSELASAGTLLLCIDEPVFVKAVANQAARVELPEEVIDTFVNYWADPDRDVTLGDYIMQIAEYAEKFAIETHGDLGNPIFAQPRSIPNNPN